MNLLEAIQNCGENWFRPVGSYGIAYTFERDHLVYTDGYNFYSGGVSFLKSMFMAKWEIVTHEQVRKERK